VDPHFRDAALAIYAGDPAELRRVLDATPGLATERSSTSHPTLLQLVACEAAALPDPTASAQVLLEAGADPDEPLIAAAGCGSASVVEYLLRAGADIEGPPDWGPLDEAIYWCQLTIASSLIEQGAQIRRLSAAAGAGRLADVERFLDGDRPTGDAGPIGSPFPDTVPAAEANDPVAVVNHAFVMAVNSGAQVTARRLHRAGAEVNARPPGFHWAGTALHAAVWRGDAELVAWLVELGADPTVRDGMVDADAWQWARHHENEHLLELLDRARP
jgi:hypothetical protein